MKRAAVRVLAARVLVSLGALFVGACASHPPLPTVAHVDLPRFMGDWYVLAHIPASTEADAYNGVETYALSPDGSIATTYAFRDGSFASGVEVFHPNGVVWDTETNATWGMQFFWPLRFEYLITYLDPDYSVTIIGRTARDYAWIMAREPVIDRRRYAELVQELTRQGYDVARLRRVPQRWPDPEHPASKARESRPTESARRSREPSTNEA